MASRRFLLQVTALTLSLALTAFGGWAVHPYLPAPERAARPTAAVPETTEDLVARLETAPRSQKQDLHRREQEFSERMRIERAEIERQEASILSELKKREEDNQRRLANLGHRPYPGLASGPRRKPDGSGPGVPSTRPSSRAALRSRGDWSAGEPYCGAIPRCCSRLLFTDASVHPAGLLPLFIHPFLHRVNRNG